jgi:cyclophilin family peptidyl-prolyl cis-trans isomerase
MDSFDKGSYCMRRLTSSRRFSVCTVLLAFASSPPGVGAIAQDDGHAGDTGAPEAELSPSIAATEAKAAFQRELLALKEPMKQMEFLWQEFQVADETRRAQLQLDMQKHFKAAEATLPRVVEAAISALKATGGKDDQIEQFLMAVAGQRVATDRFEAAMPAIQSLTQAGVEHPRLDILGALAAFAVADYDAATRHFERLEKSGALSDPPAANNPQELELYRLVASLQGIVAEHKEAWEKEEAIRAAEAQADDLPRVLIKTNRGDITLELFENEAPNTVKNFVTLVEQGAYDGTLFHRVLPNFMAQGGEPTTAGKPDVNYRIPCECYQPNARKHFRGSLSMAHGGRDTASAGFFLTFRPTPHLDGKTFYPESANDAHTVFGRVIDGIDVLAEIQRIDPQAAQQASTPPEPDRILEAKILRKRQNSDYGDFRKLLQ